MRQRKGACKGQSPSAAMGRNLEQRRGQSSHTTPEHQDIWHYTNCLLDLSTWQAQKHLKFKVTLSKGRTMKVGASFQTLNP